MARPTALELLCLASILLLVTAVATGEQEAYAPGRVLYALRPGATLKAGALGLAAEQPVGGRGARRARITDGKSVRAKVAQLKSFPGVLHAEPDYVVHNTAVPNDLLYPLQWHLPAISAPAAWDITTGSDAIKICVIDGGVRADHPDMQGRVYKGWNMIEGEDITNYYDTNGHGTHTASTLGAASNNGVGGAGVAWNVKLAVCRFTDTEGRGVTSDAIKCVRACREEGVLLSSNSWGGAGFSYFLQEEIRAAGEAGQLFVAAAGNGKNASDVGYNLDRDLFFPASYTLPNILAVASTDPADQLSVFKRSDTAPVWGASNWGPNSVHLAAPGSGIWSAYGYGEFAYSSSMSGTSMACPQVAGAAVLVQAAAMAAGRTLGYAEIKEHLLNGVDRLTALKGKVVSGGRLNVQRALLSAQGRLKNSYTVRESAYVPRANGGMTCSQFKARSAAAYRQATARLLRLKPNRVKLDCKCYDQNRLRIIIRVTTPRLRLPDAKALLATLGSAVADGSYGALVTAVSNKALAPLAGEGGCLEGVFQCPRLPKPAC